MPLQWLHIYLCQGNQLLHRLTLAIPQAIVYHHTFTACSEGISDAQPQTLVLWKRQAIEWENGLSDVCPYELPDESVSHHCLHWDSDSLIQRGHTGLSQKANIRRRASASPTWKVGAQWHQDHSRRLHSGGARSGQATVRLHLFINRHFVDTPTDNFSLWIAPRRMGLQFRPLRSKKDELSSSSIFRNSKYHNLSSCPDPAAI